MWTYAQFRLVAINAVGRGTEASPSTRRSAWSVENAIKFGSAASVGFMQHDFGQRPGSARVFLEEYNQWAKAENSRLISEGKKALYSELSIESVRAD